MAETVTVAGARLKFVAGWEAIPASLAGTAVSGKIIAGFARNAGAGLVVACAVTETGAVARASKELVAVRVVMMGRQARAAVFRHVKPSVAGIADTGLVIACTVAETVAVARTRLKLVTRWVAIPAVNT